MEVDPLLVVDGDQEGRHVDDPTIDGDVPALDKGSGVVDRVCQLGAEDAGLQSAFEQLVEGHGEDVIEPVLVFAVQQPELEHLPEQGRALEDPALVLWLQGEEFSRTLTKPGEDELDAPNLSLALQSELATYLDLLIVPLLLEGPARLLGGF